ncbi:MAG TPA: N-methylproline demethylase, partial [Roseiarcus sp.]
AEAGDVMVEDPDVVVVATGGLPNLSFLDAGEVFATSSWDILTGAVRPAGKVLLYDDNGAHPGMTAAEFIAGAGSELEVVTPERMLAPDIGGTSYPAYFRALSLAGAAITINLRLEKLERRGNKVAGIFFDDYGKRRIEKEADQIVVEHGSTPVDELYFALKPGSVNLGEIDHRALLANRPQAIVRNPPGRYRLFRIGDAVSSRNIHAAVYDAIRLMKDI